MNDAKFAKTVLLINALVPLAMLAWDALVGPGLGANPVEFVLHTTGMLSLIFLTLTLTVTPARKITGINFFSHFRRMLGILAFFYGCVHLVTYSIFYKGISLEAIWKDTVEHRFILLGMAALLLMVPLAITSTNSAIKRMGAARWKQLHKAAYACAILGALHYLMLVKRDIRIPLGFIAVIGVLLLYRVYDAVRRPRRRAAPPGGRGFAVRSSP